MLPSREHLPRLTNVFPKNPLYFVTCCTACRRTILASSDAAAILVRAWQVAPEIHHWAVGKYVIMPDHVHFFARPEPTAKSLPAFVRDWKKWTSRQLSTELCVPSPVWQPEFFDHVLRSAASYAEKWDYVRQNPVRANLVSAADEWEFAGECASLTF